MMQPIPDIMPLAPTIPGCCLQFNVMPWLISILIPLIAVGVIIYFSATRPKTADQYES